MTISRFRVHGCRVCLLRPAGAVAEFDFGTAGAAPARAHVRGAAKNPEKLLTNLCTKQDPGGSVLSKSELFDRGIASLLTDLYKNCVISAPFARLRPARRRCTVLAVISACGWMGLTGPTKALELSSGIEAELREVFIEEIGTENWLRFRFIAPEIDRTRPDAPGFAVLEQDFPLLCTEMALPYLERHEIKADRIVISIADRHVEFGTTDPDATQYFEQFRPEDGGCVWEAF